MAGDQPERRQLHASIVPMTRPENLRQAMWALTGTSDGENIPRDTDYLTLDLTGRPEDR